jgi:hypothetical protein
MGADTLIGNDVYSRQAEKLGEVKEIMLDMRSGRISYAVLSFGGFLGMGEKLFAIPWSALTLDTHEQALHARRGQGAAGAGAGLRQGHLARHGQPRMGRGYSRLLRSPHVFDLALQAGVSLVAWVAVRGKEGCDTPVSWRLSSPEEMSGLAMESTAVPCAA